jgi:hypothetical protein
MQNANNNIPPYLLVVNPYTGKSVNVLPMFALLDENHAADSGSLRNFILPLQEMQDFVNTEMKLSDNSVENLNELGFVNCNIIRLRRMFEKMDEKV